MRVHDRMPVILATDAARRWIEPGPLPAELLAPYPAEEMTAWRVSDDAKNSRIEPHPAWRSRWHIDRERRSFAAAVPGSTGRIRSRRSRSGR